jgi:hypothetical protein
MNKIIRCSYETLFMIGGALIALTGVGLCIAGLFMVGVPVAIAGCAVATFAYMEYTCKSR